MWIKLPATPNPSPKAHISSKTTSTVHNIRHLINEIETNKKTDVTEHLRSIF
jgi:hypothetical protein